MGRHREPSLLYEPVGLDRAGRRQVAARRLELPIAGGVWFSFFVPSLSIYIVASISRSYPPVTMVNGYDVKTPVGHKEGSQAFLVIMRMPSLNLAPFQVRLIVDGTEWLPSPAISGGRVPRLKSASPRTPESHEERKPYRVGTPPGSRVRLTHIEALRRFW